jgi:hypothetical protein
MRACDNPFASDRIESIPYHPQGTTWEAIMTRLADLRYRAAIVGPHGTGKTTLLEELAARLERLGYIPQRALLNDRSPRLPRGMLREPTSAQVVLIDGADHLPRLSWLMLRLRCRHAGGLVVTCHAAGMLPTLVRTTASPELLRQIVTRLQPHHAGDLADLFHRHAGNIRAALRELYDGYAAGKESGRPVLGPDAPLHTA